MVRFSILNVFNAVFFAQALLTVVCLFVVYKVIKFVFGKATNKQRLKPGSVGRRRRLGFYEAMFDTLSSERNGTMNICLTVSLRSKQSLSHQHVRDALVMLAKRQPMLRAIITKENEDKYFEIKEINEVITMLNISTSDVKASDWKDVWFEYTAKQTGHHDLLWRVVILQEEFMPDSEVYANTLMFNFNHSSSDGVSCVKFCKQFLQYINEAASGTGVDQEISSLNMLPYFDNIVTQKRTWYSVLNFMFTYCGLRRVLGFLIQRIISHEFQTMKCNPYCAQFPPMLDQPSFVGPNRLSTKVFTEMETKSIVQACKSNNCTVTGAVMATAHLAFCDLIRDGMKESNDTQAKCNFAINAQRFCDPKPDEDYLGIFVYPMNEFHMKYESAAVDFWTVAQEATKKIHGWVKAERFIVQEALISETMKPRELVDLVDRESFPRFSCDHFFSSLGAFDFGQNQETQTYRLHECFVSSVGHNLPDIFNHFVYTINGKMTWLIMSDVSTVESRHAESFASCCFGRFIEVALS
jgi:hypothetical protein